jgi:hypothetical protein
MGLERRLGEMARIISENPELLLKLSVTSLILSLATAKLYIYQMDIINELRQDAESLENLKQAYSESADADEMFAERFTGVSAEVDKIMIEMG